MARYETIDAALANPGDCTELYILHFGSTHKKLKALPPEVGKLTKLEKVILNSVPEDVTFPDEMGELAALKMLHISRTSWTTLPGWMFALANLVDLSVSGAFTQVSDEITQLEKLRELDLWSQHWKGYPEAVCKLVALTKLNIGGTSFRELPKAFGNLVELRELELERLEIEALPPSIVKMKKLTKLSLSGNQLSELPAAIGELSNLVELDLSTNHLTRLPPSMGKLKKLETLKAQHNRLTSLPEAIGELSALNDLNVSTNALTELPDSLAKLHKLTELDLRNNPFTELPEVVCRIPNLTSLEILEQRGPIGAEKTIGPIRTLPAAIGKLKKLRVLGANYGFLESLPPEIGQLQSLQNLYLRRNVLRELPPEIGKLPKLTYVALEENALQSVPETLAACKELRELNLTANTFPKDEIAKLHKLKKALPRCQLGMPRVAKGAGKKKAPVSNPARLSEAAKKQLARLGAKLKSPEKIPAPKKVKIGDDEYLMPEALRQLGQDVKWPKGVTYEGEVNHFEMWTVEFGGLGSGPLEEYECLHHGAYALLATIDTGNMMLLVDLEDKKPEDPMTFWLDHEEFDLHEPSAFERLSKLLAKLEVEKDE